MLKAQYQRPLGKCLFQSLPATCSSRRLPVVASSSDQNSDDVPRYPKGKNFEGDKRRRGRPAHLRSPYDTPLRDGNRDRLIGLLTERAAKTLMCYLMETNLNVYHWFSNFYKHNPIPKEGNWDEVSGDNFLRQLLAMPMEAAKYDVGRESLFDNSSTCGVDPRSIAQRVMEIRAQLSLEFVQDLQQIAEENQELLRETLTASLTSMLEVPTTEERIGNSLRPGTTPSARVNNPPVAKPKVKREPIKLTASPANWRLKAEVELEVHGDNYPGVDSTNTIPSNLPATASFSIKFPLPSPPPVPEQPLPDLSSLHPEVAEVVTAAAKDPMTLTPEVAQLLSTYATNVPGGQLHPAIADALQLAHARGIILHPEVWELVQASSSTAVLQQPGPSEA